MMMMMRRKDDYGERLRYDPTFTGPVVAREKTNYPWIFVFLVFQAISVVLGFYCIFVGDLSVMLEEPQEAPRSALHRCGGGGGTKTFVFVHDVHKCADSIPECARAGCVVTCPNTSYYGPLLLLQRDFPAARERLLCKAGVHKELIGTEADMRQMWRLRKCAMWYTPTKEVNGVCLPSYDYKDYKEGQPVIPRELVREVVLRTAWGDEAASHMLTKASSYTGVMVAALLVAVFVNVFYVFMLFRCTRFVAWGSIVINCVLIAGLAVTFAVMWQVDKSSNLSEESSRNMSIMFLVLFLVSVVLLIAVIVMMIYFRKQIFRAIVLYEEAARALRDTKSCLLLPVVILLFVLAFLTWCSLVQLYIVSLAYDGYKVSGMGPDCECSNGYKDGDVCTPTAFAAACHGKGSSYPCSHNHCMQSFQYNLFTWLVQGVHLLATFWTLFLVHGLEHMVLALVFSMWYWTRDKEALPDMVVCYAARVVLRYHLGTIALGSFILAVVHLLQQLLEKKTEEAEERTNPIMTLLACLVACLESFLQFLQYFAFIYCAIHGTAFWISCKQSFCLIQRNIVQTCTSNKVASCITSCSSLLILCISLSPLLLYLALTVESSQELLAAIIPLVLVTMVCLVFNKVILMVVTLAMNTIFFCFLEDYERNDGSSSKPYYMTPQLKDAFSGSIRKE